MMKFLLSPSPRPRLFHVVRYMAMTFGPLASPTYRGLFHIHGLNHPYRLRPGQKQELTADPSTGHPAYSMLDY
jgi:hypothetical protein